MRGTSLVLNADGQPEMRTASLLNAYALHRVLQPHTVLQCAREDCNRSFVARTATQTFCTPRCENTTNKRSKRQAQQSAPLDAKTPPTKDRNDRLNSLRRHSARQALVLDAGSVRRRRRPRKSDGDNDRCVGSPTRTPPASCPRVCSHVSRKSHPCIERRQNRLSIPTEPRLHDLPAAALPLH